MPRKRAADFDQSFLDLVEAPPSVYTAEKEAATKIDRRQKRRVKDYYPIYSDNPGGLRPFGALIVRVGPEQFKRKHTSTPLHYFLLSLYFSHELFYYDPVVLLV